MVNLHKFKIKDKNEKNVEIRGWNWSSSSAKLHEIKSLKLIRSEIERNHKSND
jgi:hypothetical protein